MKLSIRNARSQLTKIDALLRSHREVTLTRRNVPIARITRLNSGPLPSVPSRARIRALMRPIEVTSEALVRQDRDERW